MDIRKPYNKKAYVQKNFKYQNVCFKIEEMDEIEEFCSENGVAKNTLIRHAVMQYVRGKKLDSTFDILK